MAHNLTDELTLREKYIATVSVAALFADMSYIGNRGQNFSWHKFPEMAARYAKGQFVMGTKASTPVKEEAVHLYAREFAQDLCRKAHLGRV